jgi:UDP-N-acetylenolpyruvoylglucosamine reductase
LKLRKEKQPLECPSAGSVFKNPEVDSKHLAKLIKRYPELKDIAKTKRDSTSLKKVKTLEVSEIVEIPAGWLIESLGLSGKKIGGAMVSEKHCNFIVNAGDAKAEDVVILISLMKQKVRDSFGIQLVEEIEYVGF